MISFVQIEEEFNYLLYRLSSPFSNRIKLKLVQAFLLKLSKYPKQSILQSYHMQIFPHLKSLTTYETLQFRSPEFTENLSEYLNLIASVCGEQIEKNDIEEIRHILHEYLCTVHLILGEWRKALSYLPGNIIISTDEIDWKPDYSLSDKVSILVKTLSSKYPGISTFLCDIRDKIKQNFHDGINDYINVLLVEKDGNSDEEISTGVIQPLSIRLKRRSAESDRDIIFFNYREEPYNELMYNQAQDAWHYARSNMNYRESFKKKEKFYRVEYIFPHKESFYTGDSLGAGMGALNISMLSQKELRQHQYLLKTDFTVTGRMDRHGNILPITAKSLEKKIKAFFFSPFYIIVVPKDNSEHTEKIIKQYADKYPHRKYKIKTPGHIQEALSDVEIARKIKIPLSKRMLEKRRKKRILSIAVFGILLFFIYGIYYLLQDRNPASWEIKDRYLSVFNKAGDFLWSYEFGEKLNSVNYKDISSPNLIIADFNNDGKNEVVMGICDDFLNITGKLFYFSSKGEKLWEYSDHRETQWGEIKYNSTFKCGPIFSNDFDNDSKAEIVAVFTHYPWFPTRLVVLDNSGNVMGEYWNSGYIYTIDFIDINNDSVDEIIFGATNNEYNQASIGVLDFKHVKGHSPQLDSYYTIQNVSEGEQIYYLLFPNINYIFGKIARNRVLFISAKYHGEIKINVEIANIKTGSIYLLDKSFNINEVSLTDGSYRYYYKKFNNELHSVISEDSLRSLLTGIKYWNGDEWVDTVAVNKMWR